MATKPIKDHPAFPVAPHAATGVRGNSGMSMLDFFAGCAAIGLSSTEITDDSLATEAYNIAERLMQERQNRYTSK